MPLKLEVTFCVHGVISPLLANIYLHYVYDLWLQRWRCRVARGDVIAVRYADDSVVGFEHGADAAGFLEALRARLAKFGLTLNDEKTRVLEFGRYAAERRSRAGHGRPEVFDFLGFTHSREDILAHAWAQCRSNKGAPGVDGQDFADGCASSTRSGDKGAGPIHPRICTGTSGS